MKFPDTLAELEHQISAIMTPADLFNGDIDGTLKKLLAFCHPDRNPGNALAAKLFVQVQQLADEAHRPPVTLKSPKRTYTLISRRFVGDVADIYLAEGQDGDSLVLSNKYLVKVSRFPGGEKLLDRERQALTELHTAADDLKYRCYFPLIVESFPAHDRFKRRVNVFSWEDGWFSLESVLKKYPSGLSPRHTVWIFKRLLTAIGFAGHNELVHGAILPQHILLRPKDHALRVVGWGQSVKSGTAIQSVPAKSKDVFPSNLSKKPVAKSGADVWLASRVLEEATANIPDKMRTFLMGCRLDGQWSRELDAWELYDEFDELAKALFGKPKFMALEM